MSAGLFVLSTLLIISILLYETTGNPSGCEESITTVWGQNVCKGRIIFEDNFDNLNVWKWKPEVKMDGLGEDQFVIFDKQPQNLFVRDGRLFIVPEVLDERTVTRGQMVLKECTGQERTIECARFANSFNIIPPVRSAKISTQDSFSFRYGIVEIRAKLSSGDWLIPQLLLDSTFEEYGSLLQSGRVRIAKIHGNENLLTDDSIQDEIGVRRLFSDIIVRDRNSYKGNGVKLFRSVPWSDEFHIFKLIWLPDKMLFSVDNGENYELFPEISTNLMDALNRDEIELDESLRSNSSYNAPFDTEFFLSLGVSVGRCPEYTRGFDDLRPWSRKENTKAVLNFWQDRTHWHTSWNGKDTSLQVDYVRVTAI
uniref:GRP5 n=1 Tax=Nilaparvata lugens TaxID=108931 RepID=M9ZTU5_NILLU|nr:GRP5 [Nilaparvata lugens]